MRHTTKKKSHGQGIVEYILVTALVALASMAIFQTFRDDVKSAYKKAGQAIVQGVDNNSSSQSSNE